MVAPRHCGRTSPLARRRLDNCSDRWRSSAAGSGRVRQETFVDGPGTSGALNISFQAAESRPSEHHAHLRHASHHTTFICCRVNEFIRTALRIVAFSNERLTLGHSNSTKVASDERLFAPLQGAWQQRGRGFARRCRRNGHDIGQHRGTGDAEDHGPVASQRPFAVGTGLERWQRQRHRKPSDFRGR